MLWFLLQDIYMQTILQIGCPEEVELYMRYIVYPSRHHNYECDHYNNALIRNKIDYMFPENENDNSRSS